MSDQTTLDLSEAMKAGLVISDDHPGLVSEFGPGGKDAGRVAADGVAVEARGVDGGDP